MSKISELIRAAKDEVVEPQTGSHSVVVGGEVVELVFTKLEPLKWRNIVADFPPRDGVLRDQNLGYNFDLAPSAYPASNISVVIGGESSEITDDEWGDLFAVLESPDLFAISTLMWGMHEWEPREKAKKVLLGAKKK